jgi:GMP synthase-like glutamine amidotransferase
VSTNRHREAVLGGTRGPPSLGYRVAEVSQATPRAACGNHRPGSFRSDKVELRAALGRRALVSSAHHQAISNVAPGFTVAARSDDGLIEAIEAERIFAVEWHPETDSTGPAIYGKLVSLASPIT